MSDVTQLAGDASGMIGAWSGFYRTLLIINMFVVREPVSPAAAHQR